MHDFPLTDEPAVVALRDDAMSKLRAAERALYEYYGACDVGSERTWAATMYSIVHTAPREART